jgi:glycogen debranching enzyme
MSAARLTDLITVVGAGTVVMSTRGGDLEPSTITGVFHGDRRVLSHLRLTVERHTLSLLSLTTPAAGQAVMHHLVVDTDGNQRALLTRTRTVHGHVDEQIVVRAFGGPVTLDLRVQVAADFADLQRVRYGAAPPAPTAFDVDGQDLVAAGGDLGVRVSTVDGTLDAGGAIAWTVTAAPGAPAVARFTVRPSPEPADAAPWATELRVRGAHAWQRAVQASVSDLGALRVTVPARGISYIGAGAPWYMALFGRDALLTAFESLLLGTDHALDTLDALAAFQGTAADTTTGEEPGKILHELRTGHAGIFGLQPWQPYYGSVDATPLFVVLLGEVERWGAPAECVRALLPTARAAIAWCEANGGRHPQGFLTYEADEHALRNQGWKDSADAMVHADGSPAGGPIALAEAQAYHWRALREMAALEARLGDPGAAAGLRARADRLQVRLAHHFWSAERRLLAMAIDGAGRPLAVASTNAGHCLWAGVLDQRTGDAVAAMLGAPAMDAGWGLRTLGATERAYDPMSYHRGSVWPHDSALVIDGLARYGHSGVAARLVDGLLAAAEHHGWRLPELYAGYGSDEVPAPVPYPVACSPQAWSAAVPLHLLRTLLRLEPDVPAGTVSIGPALADVTLQVEGIRVGEHRLDLTVDGGRIAAHADPPLRILHGSGDEPRA